MSWKAGLGALARRLGWHLSRNGVVRLDATDGYLTTGVLAGRVYAPWTQPPFTDLLPRIRPWTLVSDDRCYILHQFTLQCAWLPGDFAECGVYKGGTAMLCASALRDAGAGEKALHLFDTFQGMPEEASRDPGGHVPGQFGDTSLAAVQSRLADYPSVRFHPGLIPATLRDVADRTFAFVYLDLDLYQSTLDSLRFFYPRMVPGAVFLGDDYGFPRYRDAAKTGGGRILCRQARTGGGAPDRAVSRHPARSGRDDGEQGGVGRGGQGSVPPSRTATTAAAFDRRDRAEVDAATASVALPPVRGGRAACGAGAGRDAFGGDALRPFSVGRVLQFHWNAA